MRPGAYQHLAELVIPADERTAAAALAQAGYMPAEHYAADYELPYIQRYGSDERPALLDALAGEWGRAAA